MENALFPSPVVTIDGRSHWVFVTDFGNVAADDGTVRAFTSLPLRSDGEPDRRYRATRETAPKLEKAAADAFKRAKAALLAGRPLT